MSRPRSKATQEALKDVASGMSLYAAARKHSRNYTTLWRAALADGIIVRTRAAVEPMTPKTDT